MSRIVRATAEIKIIESKGKKHGFQICQLRDADGGYEKFEAYFNPQKASHAWTPGDYTVKASEPKVIDGRLVIYPDLEPLKAPASRAAA